MVQRVGVIGLGLMGRGIAKNLLAKGFPLTAMAHRNREPLERLIEGGAVEASTPRDMAAACDVVLLCVTGSSEVEAVIFGPDGILEGAHPGLVLIDCSTSEPSSTMRTADKLAQHGVKMADAPLARTPVEAEAGRLNTMVGATEEVFSSIHPVLSAFCENIFHVGPLGSGHKLKLINNFLAMGQAVLIAEAVSVCAATGLDLQRFYDVISAGGANSGIFQLTIGKLLQTGELSGLKFSISNARKDIRYYRRMTEEAGLVGNLGDNVLAALTVAENLGMADRFIPSLIEVQEIVNDIVILKRDVNAESE